MKILTSLLFFLISLNIAEAQETSDSLILTREQHNKWLADLKNSTTPIEMIRQRILLDTNVYITQHSAPDRIRVDTQKDRGQRHEGYGKPMIIIDGYFIDIGNNTKIESIIDLSQLLTDKQMNVVVILMDGDPKAAAIYGSRASFGVIILETLKKKTARRIREIDFVTSKSVVLKD